MRNRSRRLTRHAFVGHLATRVALLALAGMWFVALTALFAQPCACAET